MANLTLQAGRLKSTIKIPGSKSYANRALILSALKPTPVVLKNLPLASDVLFLQKAFKQIGIGASQFPACELADQTIDIGDGGTTARFLASMLLKGTKTYRLLLGERLKDRPWDEFLDFANAHGASAQLQGNVLTIKGPVKFPKRIEVDCSRTTQFASGLRLATAFDDVEVIPLNLSSSQSYWAMTEELIKTFRNTDSFSIPLDWSSASYPLAFAALNQTIDFPDLYEDPFQADSKFIELLRSFDGVTDLASGIRVTQVTNHRSVKMDMSDALDLVPAMSFFLSYIAGTHELQGIRNLVHKESDRLSEILKLLSTFNKTATTNGESLFIEGSLSKTNEPKDLNFPMDHRMVMTGALFLRHNQGGALRPTEAVEKSYPDFFKTMELT
jgi:3-phosphoshikimate 1-carboxyvinyltransferase